MTKKDEKKKTELEEKKENEMGENKKEDKEGEKEKIKEERVEDSKTGEEEKKKDDNFVEKSEKKEEKKEERKRTKKNTVKSVIEEIPDDEGKETKEISFEAYLSALKMVHGYTIQIAEEVMDLKVTKEVDFNLRLKEIKELELFADVKEYEGFDEITYFKRVKKDKTFKNFKEYLKIILTLKEESLEEMMQILREGGQMSLDNEGRIERPEILGYPMSDAEKLINFKHGTLEIIRELLNPVEDRSEITKTCHGFLKPYLSEGRLLFFEQVINKDIDYWEMLEKYLSYKNNELRMILVGPKMKTKTVLLPILPTLNILPKYLRAIDNNLQIRLSAISEIVIPKISLVPPPTQELTNRMGMRTNTSSPFQGLVNLRTSKTYEMEIAIYLLALSCPGYFKIDLSCEEMDKRGTSPQLKLLELLLMKCLFTYTEDGSYSMITKETANDIDRRIATVINTLKRGGRTAYGKVSPLLNFEFASARNLSTTEVGSGWLNDGEDPRAGVDIVEKFYETESRPVYAKMPDRKTLFLEEKISPDWKVAADCISLFKEIIRNDSYLLMEYLVERLSEFYYELNVFNRLRYDCAFRLTEEELRNLEDRNCKAVISIESMVLFVKNVPRGELEAKMNSLDQLKIELSNVFVLNKFCENLILQDFCINRFQQRKIFSRKEKIVNAQENLKEDTGLIRIIRERREMQSKKQLDALVSIYRGETRSSKNLYEVFEKHFVEICFWNGIIEEHLFVRYNDMIPYEWYENIERGPQLITNNLDEMNRSFRILEIEENTFITAFKERRMKYFLCEKIFEGRNCVRIFYPNYLKIEIAEKVINVSGSYEIKPGYVKENYCLDEIIEIKGAIYLVVMRERRPDIKFKDDVANDQTGEILNIVRLRNKIIFQNSEIDLSSELNVVKLLRKNVIFGDFSWSTMKD